MVIITPGHKYELENFENKKGIGQALQFIQKEPIPDEHIPNADGSVTVVPGGFKTVCDGTTNEEVLEVLIDRMQFVNAKHRCLENDLVIMKLTESLALLNKRTADRQKRGVEGTNNA